MLEHGRGLRSREQQFAFGYAILQVCPQTLVQSRPYFHFISLDFSFIVVFTWSVATLQRYLFQCPFKALRAAVQQPVHTAHTHTQFTENEEESCSLFASSEKKRCVCSVQPTF